MSTDLVVVNKQDNLNDFKDLIKRRGIHHILVEDKEGNLCGIISSEDIAKSQSWLTMDRIQAKHIMTPDPFTVYEDYSVETVKEQFLNNRFRALPVLDQEENLIGIVTPYDLLNKASF